MTEGPRNPYTGRRFRTALKHFAIGRAAQAVASVAFLLCVVRLLDPAAFGAYMVLLGVVEVCRPLSSMGLLPAVQQYLPEMALHASREQLRQFVRWATAFRFGALVLFGAGIYVFWPLLAAALGLQDLTSVYGVLIAFLVITMLGAGFNDHILEALLEQRRAQVLRTLVPVGRLAGLLLLAYTDQVTLESMLVVDIVVTSACLLAAEWVLMSQLRRLSPDGSRYFSRAKIVRFTWHLSGAQLLNAISSAGTLRMIVSALLGPQVAGQFAFIQQIVLQLQRFMPSLLLANLVRPMLVAASVTGDRENLHIASRLLWKSNTLLVLPLVGMAWVGGMPLMRLLSGGRIDDALTLGVLVLGLLASAQLHVTGMLMQVLHLSATLRNLSTLALIAPVLVYAAAPRGLVWAAAGAASAAWLRSVVSSQALRRLHAELRPDTNGMLRAGAAVVLSVLLVWPLRSWSNWWALGMLPVVYMLLLRLLMPLDTADDVAIGKALKGRHGQRLHRIAAAFTRRRP